MVDQPRPEGIPPVEAFHNGYYYFIEAVWTLHADAQTQCARMGDYNVAWELKEDVSAGKYLAMSELLNDRERELIRGLVASLEAIPEDVLRAASGRAANLAAMEHECWLISRMRAGQTLQALKSFTAENARYLRVNPDAP